MNWLWKSRVLAFFVFLSLTPPMLGWTQVKEMVGTIDEVSCAVSCHFDNQCTEWILVRHHRSRAFNKCYLQSEEFVKLKGLFKTDLINKDIVTRTGNIYSPDTFKHTRLVTGPVAVSRTTTLNMPFNFYVGCSYTIMLWAWVWKPSKLPKSEMTLFTTRESIPQSTQQALLPSIVYNLGAHPDRMFLSTLHDKGGNFEGMWGSALPYNQWVHLSLSFEGYKMTLHINGKQYKTQLSIKRRDETSTMTCPVREGGGGGQENEVNLPYVYDLENNTIIHIGGVPGGTMAGILQNMDVFSGVALTTAQINKWMSWHPHMEYPTLESLFGRSYKQLVQPMSIEELKGSVYGLVALGVCPEAVCGPLCVLGEEPLQGVAGGTEGEVDTEDSQVMDTGTERFVDGGDDGYGVVDRTEMSVEAARHGGDVAQTVPGGAGASVSRTEHGQDKDSLSDSLSVSEGQSEMTHRKGEGGESSDDDVSDEGGGGREGRGRSKWRAFMSSLERDGVDIISMDDAQVTALLSRHGLSGGELTEDMLLELWGEVPDEAGEGGYDMMDGYGDYGDDYGNEFGYGYDDEYGAALEALYDDLQVVEGAENLRDVLHRHGFGHLVTDDELHALWEEAMGTGELVLDFLYDDVGGGGAAADNMHGDSSYGEGGEEYGGRRSRTAEGETGESDVLRSNSVAHRKGRRGRGKGSAALDAKSTSTPEAVLETGNTHREGALDLSEASTSPTDPLSSPRHSDPALLADAEDVEGDWGKYAHSPRTTQIHDDAPLRGAKASAESPSSVDGGKERSHGDDLGRRSGDRSSSSSGEDSFSQFRLNDMSNHPKPTSPRKRTPHEFKAELELQLRDPYYRQTVYAKAVLHAEQNSYVNYSTPPSSMSAHTDSTLPWFGFGMVGGYVSQALSRARDILDFKKHVKDMKCCVLRWAQAGIDLTGLNVTLYRNDTYQSHATNDVSSQQIDKVIQAILEKHGSSRMELGEESVQLIRSQIEAYISLYASSGMDLLGELLNSTMLVMESSESDPRVDRINFLYDQAMQWMTGSHLLHSYDQLLIGAYDRSVQISGSSADSATYDDVISRYRQQALEPSQSALMLALWLSDELESEYPTLALGNSVSGLLGQPIRLALGHRHAVDLAKDVNVKQDVSYYVDKVLSVSAESLATGSSNDDDVAGVSSLSTDRLQTENEEVGVSASPPLHGDTGIATQGTDLTCTGAQDNVCKSSGHVPPHLHENWLHVIAGLDDALLTSRSVLMHPALTPLLDPVEHDERNEHQLDFARHSVTPQRERVATDMASLYKPECSVAASYYLPVAAYADKYFGRTESGVTIPENVRLADIASASESGLFGAVGGAAPGGGVAGGPAEVMASQRQGVDNAVQDSVRDFYEAEAMDGNVQAQVR